MLSVHFMSRRLIFRENGISRYLNGLPAVNYHGASSSCEFLLQWQCAWYAQSLFVGRECFCLSEDDAFHAWVELASHVVNDHEELQTGYTIMHRVPFYDPSHI